MIRDLPLVEYEHQLMFACMDMEAKGMHVDEEYAAGYLTDYLTDQGDKAVTYCRAAGIENINSSKQVTDGLQAHGATLTKKTGTGKLSADKDVLNGLIVNGGESVAALAQAIKTGKNANGNRKKYVEKVLASLDPESRVHPSITALQARTARMAVSDPPFHQLPSDDYTIRRMITARPGYVIIAIDYAQIELRVLAALSKDKRMLRAFADGEDLHQVTADACGVPRSVGKTTNFLIVYGGGAGKHSVTAGIPLGQSKRVIASFKRTYPGVNRLNKRITQQFHAGRRFVVTPTGRHLPIDRQRVYGGLNYLIQSTARDVLGMAMVNIREAGLWEYAMLPVHDELILEVPIKKAEEIGQAYANIMRIDNFLGTGVNLLTDVSKPVPSWGHLYLKEGQVMPA